VSLVRSKGLLNKAKRPAQPGAGSPTQFKRARIPTPWSRGNASKMVVVSSSTPRTACSATIFRMCCILEGVGGGLHLRMAADGSFQDLNQVLNSLIPDSWHFSAFRACNSSILAAMLSLSLNQAAFPFRFLNNPPTEKPPCRCASRLRQAAQSVHDERSGETA
jgi:hypothetical protein